jgi:hypothetical protein
MFFRLCHSQNGASQKYSGQSGIIPIP